MAEMLWAVGGRCGLSITITIRSGCCGRTRLIVRLRLVVMTVLRLLRLLLIIILRLLLGISVARLLGLALRISTVCRLRRTVVAVLILLLRLAVATAVVSGIS